MEEGPLLCMGCGSVETPIQCKCGAVFYCSDECKKSDEPYHKDHCDLLSYTHRPEEGVTCPVRLVWDPRALRVKMVANRAFPAGSVVLMELGDIVDSPGMNGRSVLEYIGMLSGLVGAEPSQLNSTDYWRAAVFMKRHIDKLVEDGCDHDELETLLIKLERSLVPDEGLVAAHNVLEYLIDVKSNQTLENVFRMKVAFDRIARGSVPTRPHPMKTNNRKALSSDVYRVLRHEVNIAGPRRPQIAVVPVVSMIRHNCLPNAAVNFAIDGAKVKATLIATSPLKAGAEITVSYMSPERQLCSFDNIAARDVYMRTVNRFTCHCELCEKLRSGADKEAVQAISRCYNGPMPKDIKECNKMLDDATKALRVVFGVSRNTIYDVAIQHARLLWTILFIEGPDDLRVVRSMAKVFLKHLRKITTGQGGLIRERGILDKDPRFSMLACLNSLGVSRCEGWMRFVRPEQEIFGREKLLSAAAEKMGVNADFAANGGTPLPGTEKEVKENYAREDAARAAAKAKKAKEAKGKKPEE